MIIRESDDGRLLLIRQTEHARLCGVMAGSWDDESLASAEPRDAVALAAAEHDNGWQEWEVEPRLNPETGRPYSYIDIPIEQHLPIYRRGVARAFEIDPYVGILVSLHGSLLYSSYRGGQPASESFLSEQNRVRDRTLSELRDDPRYREHISRERLLQSRDLIAGWDALSLFICHGAAWMEEIAFPARAGRGRRGVRVGDGGREWRLRPYPFREPLDLSITALAVEDRRYGSDAEVRGALDRAEGVRLRAELRG